MKLLKHIIRTLFALLALVCTTSCENEFIEIIPNMKELVFDYRGGDTILTIRCTDETMWYLRNEPTGWCEISPETGRSGDIVKISVSPNEESNECRTQLVLVCATESLTIDVVVKNKPMPQITPGQKVDLGLSVKWAGWNIGASSPEEYGGYYAWGETEEKSDYSYKTYKYWTDSNGNGSWDDDEFTHIGDNISGTQYDVAHVKWGGGWRMPTLDEIKELVNSCTWEWGTYKGVNGQYVTGPNGNSIFLPAAGYRDYGELFNEGTSGYYWSATLIEGSEDGAYYLYFHGGHVSWNYWSSRYCGLSVRAVTE